jgi:hypothetical protein
MDRVAKTLAPRRTDMTSISYDIEFDLDRFIKDLEGVRARRARASGDASLQPGYGRSDALGNDTDDE